jgi:transposase
MTQIQDVVGIDVSKRNLDVYVVGARQQRRVENDAAGHGELIAWLKQLRVHGAVMEASGGYERTIAAALRKASFDVRVVDPKRVRHFAKAAGRLAKNDRIDARMIAEFGAVFAATPMPHDIPLGPQHEQLSDLVGARQGLIAHQTGLRNLVAAAPPGAARRALAATLKPIDRAIAKLDRLIAETIAQHPPFAALAARLDTVPGLGPVAIAAIIAWLPELGRIDRRQIAALVGVAPYDNDSGNHNGQRSIQGGRYKLRNILYMATMGAATQHNPLLCAHYDALIKRGKLSKVALIACLRKLLAILNSMVAQQRDWAPATA